MNVIKMSVFYVYCANTVIFLFPVLYCDFKKLALKKNKAQ